MFLVETRGSGCYFFNTTADKDVVNAANGTPEGHTPFLIGEHPLIQKIGLLVRKVAVTDATILIMGESGTNKELAAEVETGNFREDLFYRLQVIPIVMPPLRERRSDIPLLVRHFLEKHNRKRPGRPAEIAEEAMAHLWEYDWPGNVRER